MGCNDIGQIKVGMVVDVVFFDVIELGFVGVMYDFIVVLFFCGMSGWVKTSFVNGWVVVLEGCLVGVDEKQLFA